MVEGIIKEERNEIYAIVNETLKYKVHFFDVERLQLRQDDKVEGIPFIYNPPYHGEWNGRLEIGTIRRVI